MYKMFKWIFPPYNSENRFFTTYNDAFGHVVNRAFKTDKTPTEKERYNTTVVDIVENVISFNLVCYNSVFDGSWSLNKYGGDKLNTPPYLVEVEIMMLDSKENFIKWQDAADSVDKKKIFSEFGYTFRRAILLGKK